MATHKDIHIKRARVASHPKCLHIGICLFHLCSCYAIHLLPAEDEDLAVMYELAILRAIFYYFLHSLWTAR